MIKKDTVIRKALCDACGKSLSSSDLTNADGTACDVHYGRLSASFGYGSRLDSADNVLSKLDLCEECYEKCLKALNLPASQYETPWYLRVIHSAFENDDKPFDDSKNDRRGAYWAPLWLCLFCGWTESRRGYSIPEHSCPNLERIRAERDGCPLCRTENPAYLTTPFYSERQDAWIHHGKKNEKTIVCSANKLLIELMRKDFRVDPKWLKRSREIEAMDRADEENRGKKGEPDGLGPSAV